MGVTISSKNHSIDLGYYGFFRLRQKIAELIGNDVYEHYCKLRNTPFFETEDLEDQYWENYDKTTETLIEQYPKNIRKVFGFLYTSDVEGSVSYGTCKQILQVIGDYDDDLAYGYAGRPDCARFKDFKNLLKDCVDTKSRMRWI